MNNNFEQEAFVRGFNKAASEVGLTQGQVVDLLAALQTPSTQQRAEQNASEKIAALLAGGNLSR